MASLEKIVVLLRARGQLFYTQGTNAPVQMVPPQNVTYSSCTHFGVCAYTQDADPSSPPFQHKVFSLYKNGNNMDTILSLLAEEYVENYKDMIHEKWDEFKYQTNDFWTKKLMMYDKYLRFYPKDGIGTNTFGLFAFRVGNTVEPIDLDQFIPKTNRVQLSTLIQQIQQLYPGSPIEVYDMGCLKLLSDKEIIVNGVSEPDQTTRLFPLTGGKRKKRNSKRKRKKYTYKFRV